MKQKLFLFFLLICSVASQAQYKKASFLTKSGRTYDVGASAHFVTKSNSTAMGFVYSYGRDKGDKRAFHWFDLELTFPSKFSYTTKDLTTLEPISVSGKTSIGIFYRYNLGIYLTDNTKEDTKILPFATGGLNFSIKGIATKTVDNYEMLVYHDLDKNPILEDAFSCGAHVGAGAIYKMTPKFGFKGVLGYNFQTNIASTSDDGNHTFYYFTSHPFLTLGVRFTMDGDN